MLGAIIGDIIGSSYETRNTKTKDFKLVTNRTHFTDDTVMTIAVAKTLYNAYPINYSPRGLKFLKEDLKYNLVDFFNEHNDLDYGSMFYDWCSGYIGDGPYNSYGNGSAMRISSVGWIAKSEEEVRILSKAISEVTHNHEEGIRGAEAIAMCIFLARHKYTKEEIGDIMINEYYPLIASLDYDELVKYYQFDVTCQGSVPQAIYAFLISNDFEDCLRIAISIGGDSDTIASMASAIAEAYYQKIPSKLKRIALDYLTDDLIDALERFNRLIELENL